MSGGGERKVKQEEESDVRKITREGNCIIKG